MIIRKKFLYLKIVYEYIYQSIFNTFDSPIFILLSKKFFGNLGGFRNNFYGRLHLFFSKWISIVLNFNKDKNLNEYKFLADQIHKNGFVNLPFRIDYNIIDRINKKCKKIDKNIPLINNCVRTTQMDSDGIFNSEIADIFNIKLTSIIETYYKSGFRVVNALKKHSFYINLKSVLNAEVYSDFWHNDTSPYSMLGIFLLLKDTSDLNGPMKVLDMHDTKKLVRLGYVREKNIEMSNLIEGQKSKSHFTGKAGTILICRITSCLHRASIPAEGYDREMMIMHTYPTLGKTIKNNFGKSFIEKYTHQ